MQTQSSKHFQGFKIMQVDDQMGSDQAFDFTTFTVEVYTRTQAKTVKGRRKYEEPQADRGQIDAG